MFFRQLLLSYLSVGFFLCLSPCRAQEGGEVSLSFVSFPKAVDEVKVKLSLSNGKLLDVQAPSKWLSDPIKVASQATWVVGDMVPGADGKPVFKEYGRTAAIAAPQQLLLLIRKGKENADGFALIAVDSRADGFGAGKYFFLNATKFDVAGVLGEEKFAIKSARHLVTKPKISVGDPTFHIALYYRENEEVRPFFSSEWRVNDKARNLIFIYNEPETGHVKFHAIKDFLN